MTKLANIFRIFNQERRGRPTLYDEPLDDVYVGLPPKLLRWLESQPGTRSEILRRYIMKGAQEDGYGSENA